MNAAQITEGTRVRVSRPKFRAEQDRAPFEGIVRHYGHSDMLVVDHPEGYPVVIRRRDGEWTTFTVEVLS